MEKKRLTAIKTKINDITGGTFHQQEGFNPSYVLSPNGLRLSRVRLLATVVDKFISENGKFASITLDDGTDTIRAKVFNAVSMIEGIDAGNIIDVIARIKEYQGEIYLVPEVITKIEDPNIEILRILEIEKQEKEIEKKRQLVFEYKKQVADASELIRIMKERFGIEQEEVEAFLQESSSTQRESKTEIIKLIETLDTGEGCDYNELIQASGLSESEIDATISILLEEGSIFEPKPGKIKKL